MSEWCRTLGVQLAIYTLYNIFYLVDLIGSFKDGIRVDGILTSPSNGGSRYEGTFRADKKWGFGHLTTAGGVTFEGNFRSNKKHGKGR